MALTLKTDVTSEPVSLSEVKKHLRIDVADEDTLLEAYLTAAREHAQELTGRAFGSQVYTLTLPAFANGHLALPRPPLVSVDSIMFYPPGASTAQAFSDYRVVNNSIEPVDGWPATAERGDAVEVEFTAGTPVPQRALVAIRELVALFEHHRVPVTQDGRPHLVPHQADRLLRGLRDWR